MTLAITPEQFQTAATAWIGAVVTVLTVLLIAIGGLWVKFGSSIKQFIDSIRHMKAQQEANTVNIVRINEAPGTPAVPLVAPAPTPMPPLAPMIPSQTAPPATTNTGAGK